MSKKPSRYFAKLKNSKAEAAPVDIETLGPSRYAVTLNGVRHEVEARRTASGALSMLVDTTSHTLDVRDDGEFLQVFVDGDPLRIEVADERRWVLRDVKQAGGADGRQTMSAPMPGKIIKVFVKPGDAVTEGQGLVVIEAMKMENELKSPKAGKVLEVSAVEGSSVENGAKLLVVE